MPSTAKCGKLPISVIVTARQLGTALTQSNAPLAEVEVSGASKRDLKQKTARGVAITMTRSVLNALLQMAAIPLLARLLTPDDYGVLTMATSVTGLAALFSEAGLGVATIQRKQISPEYVNAMFWISLGIGLLLTLLTAICSPFIAWFFDVPALTAITIVLGMTFLIDGFSIQHRALMNRNLQFMKLAWIDLAAAAVSFGVGITTAYMGWGYWALVAMPISLSLFRSITLVLIADWFPTRPAYAIDVMDSLKFGANITSFSFLNYFIRKGDDVIVGRCFGTELLGSYNRAYSLLMLPLRQVFSPLTAVLVPVLSKLQNDELAFNRLYAQANSAMAYIVNPLVVILIILPTDCVLIILGDQWKEAIPLVRILAFGGIIQPMVSSVGWVFIASGNPDKHLRWAIIACPVFLASFLIGAQFGMTGIAIGFAISAIVNGVGSLFYASKHTILDLKQLLNGVVKPYLVCALMVLPLVVVETLIVHPGIYRMAIALLVSFLVYAAFFLFDTPERNRILLLATNIFTKT